jgi:hypothetical protein
MKRGQWPVAIGAASVLVLATGALALGVTRQRTESAAEATLLRYPSARASSAPPSPETGRPGATAEYTFELFAKTVQKGSGELEQRVRGRLSITWLDSDATRERWELSNLELSGSKNGQPLQTVPGQGETCIVKRSPSGAPLELQFAPAADTESRKRLEHLVALSQGARGAGTRGKSWTSREVDGTGSYSAEYQERPDGTVQRKKVEYDSAGARAVTLRVVESEATLSFDAGRIVNVRSHERLNLQGGAVLVESSARLSRTRPLQTIAVSESHWRELPARFPFGQASQASEAERDRALARGLTLTSAVQALEAAQSDEERSQAARKLGAFCRLHPELVLELAPAFERVTEPVALALISSLKEARSEGAALLLTRLFKAADRPRAIRLHAVEALSGSGLPLNIVVTALKDGLTDANLRSTAALNLGIVAFEGQRANPELASVAKQALLEAHRAAGGRDTLFIAALGNAAAPELNEELESLSSEKDANVRGEIVWAARKLPGELADKAVTGALRNDPSPLVRRRALQVCSRWPRERECPGLERVALADTDAVARKEALRALSSRARTSADQKELLRTARVIAERDKDADTQRFAASLLAQLESPTPNKGPLGVFLNSGNPAIAVQSSGGTDP